jgi:hypothetical protein
MSETHNSNALTWVLGGALVLIGLFVAILLVSVNSQADDVPTTTTVTNAAPTVDTLVLKDQGVTVTAGNNLTVESGTTESVTITGTVSDDNGVGTSYANGDLQAVEGSLFLTTGVAQAGCDTGGEADDNNCYYAASCTLGGQVDTTTINYTCTFNVNFFADASVTGGSAATDTWTASVRVTDDSSSASSYLTQLFEIPTLLSLSIPTSISYGTLAREQATTNTDNVEMTITQFGNDQADVEVSGTAMTCTVVGSVPIANQKWSLTDLSAVAGGVTALTNSAVDTNFAIGYRTDDGSALTKILYWNIVMPDVATGTCTGTNTIAALAA